MSETETTAAPRFSQGSAKGPRIVGDYSRAMDTPGNMAALRASYKAYRMRKLKAVLVLICLVSAASWALDGVSTVIAGYFVLGIAPAAGVLAHLTISLLQSHLLDVKGLVLDMFGEGAELAAWVAVAIKGGTAVCTLLNVGAGALGGLYVLWVRGYTVFVESSLLGVTLSAAPGPVILCTIVAAIITNAERVFVWALLALLWMRKHRR